MPWQTRDLLESPNINVTIIRDPFKAFISPFRHLQRQPDHIFTLSATVLKPGFTLDEFLRDPGVNRYLINPQTMSLARRFDWLRFSRLCLVCNETNWRKSQSIDAPNFVLLYGDFDEDRADQDRLAEAVAALTLAPTLCSTTERLDAEMEMILRICTGRYPSGSVSRKNEAPEEAVSVTQAQKQQIKQMTSLDWQL